MFFTVKLVQHWDQNATLVVKQTTGHQYVCQMEQNQNKGRGHKAENTKNQNLIINHNIGENSTWKLMQYTKTTKKLRQKWKAWHSIVLIWPKEMKPSYSLTLNCQIEMASTSCVWRSTQGAQGNTLPVSTFHRMFPEKLDADGFPNIKKQFINKELIAYNGTPIKCFVNIKIPCQYNKSDWHVSTFHIVDVQGPAVLGLPSLEQLKLITLHCTVKKEDVFQTLQQHG